MLVRTASGTGGGLVYSWGWEGQEDNPVVWGSVAHPCGHGESEVPGDSRECLGGWRLGSGRAWGLGGQGDLEAGSLRRADIEGTEPTELEEDLPRALWEGIPGVQGRESS